MEYRSFRQLILFVENKNVLSFYSFRNLAAALVNSEALSKKELEELRDYFNQNC